MVSDQIYNIAPMGDKETLVPRLEGWLAAFELNGLPRERWPETVDLCKFILNLLTDRQNIPGVQSMPVADLAPPEVPE